MANLSNLDLVNEAGSTFALYTLIRNHATALGAVSKKPFVYTTTGSPVTVAPVDGGVYLVKGVGAGSVAIDLPVSTENIGMIVSARLVSLVAGAVSINLVDNTDFIDGVEDEGYSLEAAGDWIELIATSTGWYTIGSFIA